jgi:succinylglutamate desuccinylase
VKIPLHPAELIGKGELANGRLLVVLVSPREMKVGKRYYRKKKNRINK